MSISTQNLQIQDPSKIIRTCTVTIKNSLNSTLFLDESINPKKGIWNQKPPSTIAPGASTPQLVLNPKNSDSGTYGAIGYRVGSTGPLLTLTFQCPKTHSTKASYDLTSEVYPYAVPFWATVGNGPQEFNQCASQGGPLVVTFEICFRVQQINVASLYFFPVLDCYANALSPTIWAPMGGPNNGIISNPARLCSAPQKGMHVLDVAITNDCKNLKNFKLFGRDPNVNFQLTSYTDVEPVGTVTSVPILVSQ